MQASSILKTPGIREITFLPTSAAGRRVAALFKFGESGSLASFLLSFTLATLCGVIERQLWMPSPMSAPIFTLLPGLGAALFAVLPVRAFAGIVIGCWAGDWLGWSLPVPIVGLAAGSSLPDTLAHATAATAAGCVSGVLLHLVYQRFNPQLERRMFAAGIPALCGAAAGALSMWLLVPAPLTPALPIWLGMQFSSQLIGLPLLSLPIVIWWMHSHGCVLSHHAGYREFAVLAAALIAATVFGLQRVFPLQGLIGMFLVLALLATIAIRFPVRVAALVATGHFVLTGAWCVTAFRASNSLVPSDLTEVVSVQVTALLALYAVILLSIAFNSRRLVEEQLRRYARQLAAGEEDRRDRSASTVGVRFALNSLDRSILPAAADEALNSALQTVHEAEAYADRALRDLGPQGLEDRGLEPVIESYLAHLGRGANARLQFERSGPLDDLALPARRLAFRVISELVRNALQHGAPREVRVMVCAAGRILQITVSDDGLGFTPESIFEKSPSSFGLLGIRERVALEGGVFSVRSSNGAGCDVDVRLPLAS
jgi:signal transduction histidine kinase